MSADYDDIEDYKKDTTLNRKGRRERERLLKKKNIK